MIKILALSIVALSSAFAGSPESKIYSSVKKWGSTEQICCYARGSCNADELEAKMQQKCIQDGFTKCETLMKKKFTSRSGYDPVFCGEWSKGSCVVTMRESL